MMLSTIKRHPLALGALALLLTTGPNPNVRSYAQAADPCAAAVNPVACENSLPGNPASEWDVSGAGSTSIQGFATEISVNRGQTIRFKINTPSSAYRLDIYRLGYYGGLGARKLATVLPSALLPQAQPACTTHAATGLVDCGVWSESASWLVPASAVSGVYIAKLVRTDGTTGASHIVFVVRNDTGASDLVFQTADTTWQAYNQYGGNSLYVGSPAGRAYKVSYNRPFTTRGTSPEDWVFNAEYPMIRWLEANGYNVSYISGVDTDRYGAELLEHKAFLSVGHDEYWSAAQRSNVEAARAAGVHLAFFSGNEVFWKTRWEPSIDGSNAAYRTLVCYKETHANAKIDPEPNVWTGTWRDPRFSPPADGGRPENALTGTIFTVNAGATSAIEVPAEFGRLRFWRNTSIASLAAGQTATLSAGTLGYEWDEALNNQARPTGLVTLSRTTRNVSSKLLDYGSSYGSGTATHALTLYRDPTNRALVFGAGTVQWSWGLDERHDRQASVADLRMQQATLNLLADMGAQPSTPRPGLIASSAIDDVTAPASAIIAPASGATLPGGAPVAIQGTAADTTGNVAYVEVSTDGGLTWATASGTATWTYTWIPSTPGAATLLSRAVDDSANIGQPGAGIGVTVTAPPTASCPCSIWNTSVTPAMPDAGADNPVELGVKLRSDISGFITGIRFYKSAANTGTHIGNLWSASGARLATVTFTAETTSGWQTAKFSNPVPVTAGTTYVASYHATAGHYAFTSNFFTTAGVDNGPLHALATTVSPNGVFRYSATSAFPSSSYRDSNYWVDVVFDTAIVDTTGPAVVAVSPASLAIVAPPATIDATFNEPLNPATLNSTTFEVRDVSNALVSGNVSYDAIARRATFTPSAPLAYLSRYSTVLRGGTNGIADIAANPMASDYAWTFTTGAAPPPSPDQGPGGPILVVGSNGNPFTRYYAEILRNEGLNAFAVSDISTVNAPTLAAYDVVVLGEIALTASQATMFTDWVTAGGRLIAMRPDKQLAGLLGLTDANATLGDEYLRIDTTSGPGIGLVGETIQFHGRADLYTATDTTVLATLYSNATVSANRPAVTLREVGPNGGQAAAFTFDLARSIVYTRQGNPAWAGTERDGSAPIRPDDLFVGVTERDWVDLNKVHIPQADEQQRLFAKLIEQMNATRRPLPRFWYLPRGLKAAVVMTGDDHARGGTAPRFDQFLASSPFGCSVPDWTCVRGTSYIYTGTPLSNDAAASYAAQGFEIGVHINTGCANYTAASIASTYTSQLATFRAKYTLLPSPATNRTHCIVWSDWSSQASTSLLNGIRFDTNYYYWPGPWVNNRPGMFTGSGMPMRFASLTGQMIDVYQATTQMTDESGQVYPMTSDVLLDRALGPDGYYGVFTANMHTDVASSPGATAIVASALARGVPVVTAKQMLTWIDGRNASTYRSLAWDGSRLTFTIEVGAGARGLRAMVPAAVDGNPISGITADGIPVEFAQETVKGAIYATFAASTAAYRVTYAVPLPDTTITSGPTGSVTSSTARFDFVSTEAGSTFQCSLDGAAFSTCVSPVTYSALPGGAHTFSVRAVGVGGADTTPATRTWTVSVLPDTTITAGPSGTVSSRTATYQFTSTITGSTFQCSLDGAAFTACSAGTTYTNLADGSHTFQVRAMSATGADPTPAARTWTVDGTAPAISAIAVTPLTTSALITWTTNELSDSVVNYGTSAASLTSTASVATMVTSHGVTLSGLTSGVTYYYRVTSRNAAALTAAAPATAASFVTRTTVTQAPGSASITAGSLRGGSAGNLATNNGSYYQVNSSTSGTRRATWYGSFAGVSRSLTNLTVNYSGMQSRTVTQNIEIFRWSDNTWVLLNSRSVGTTEVAVSNLAPTGTAANYVSTGGEVRVRVRSVGSSVSFYTIADFLQIRYDRP